MGSTRTNVKNINVSSSVLSRSERCEIAKLSVRLETRSHGNFVVPVWKYFGELWHEDSAASSSASNSAKMYQVCAWTKITVTAYYAYSVNRSCIWHRSRSKRSHQPNRKVQ